MSNRAGAAAPSASAWAIVPVKNLASAKGRLAPALSPVLRRRLVLAMLEDVMATLRASPGIGRVLVVTRDREVAQLAARRGAAVAEEPIDADLNAAVACGLDVARRAGAGRALILPGDLPLVAPEDIAALLETSDGREAIVIAPDRQAQGTNALLIPAHLDLRPLFGECSFERHSDAARASGLRVISVARPGLACDIDIPADLAALSKISRYAFIGSEAPARLTDADALRLADTGDLTTLMARAEAMTVGAHGHLVTFSKKVFIPLTQLCRDVCHYCTFAHAPRRGEPAYLSLDQVLEIARAGAAAGCKEALFTLGDKPELRYRAAREGLAELGHETTLSYLGAAAKRVLETTGLLPHINAGIMAEADIEHLRGVSVSQGLMLETSADRLSERGGPHRGSPDKQPAVRLAMIEAAGRARVPFTTGLLIGIGETRAERIEALLAIRDAHDRHGHIQEVIIQNFRAKPGTRMAGAPEPSLDEHLWTIAAARLILGEAMNIQAPPNLQPGALGQLIKAGINDWGGVSPVTPDHVNPEAPWPHLDHLREATDAAGRTLNERLAIYPEYASRPERWLAPALITPVLRAIDASALAREDRWAPGDPSVGPPARDAQRLASRLPARSAGITHTLDRIMHGHAPGEVDVVRLFEARGDDFSAVCAAADDLRRRRVGNGVTYAVNRNINYTNICTYGCKFCAFSKGRLSTDHRDKPYDLDLEEIAERTRVAWSRGATEVCLQGGIAPKYTGHTYLAIVEAVKIGAPDIHVHAFSPLEVWHGATTLGLPLQGYLARLKEAGLSSLPGTAAEILDDEVRQVLCPDKITTDQWLEVMEAAHAVGLRSTATIMFGHVDKPVHWARHLLRVRALQDSTGGFTELVPLPFVHMESPIYLRGRARRGPTFREAMLMHAVARLTLDPLITNIQASWVKLGPEGTALCLAAGANDVGGTLMNESITRAAGAAFGQEMTVLALEDLIRGVGRNPRHRTTFYEDAPGERRHAAVSDAALRFPSAATAVAAE